MKNRIALISAIALAAIITLGSRAWSASCEPQFGDQILGWVSNVAGRQSRQLAEADFEARTFNYFLVGYDDLNARVRDVGEHLRDLSASLAADEGDLGDTPIKQAIARQSSSTKLLSEFYKVRAAVDEISKRHVQLQTPPTEAIFQLQGLQNIGRATLLESLQQLGDSAQKLLVSRYSVYVSVTVDRDGNVKDAKVQRNGDMVDTVVLAAASYLPTPYTIAIVVFFEIGRQIFEEDACRKKVDEQKDRVRQAYERLPTVLMTRESLFKLYYDKYSARLKDFESEATKLTAAHAQLDSTWKQLFAYNAARAQTANAILTTAKVQDLEKSYLASGDTDGIFNNVALSRVAQKIADLNNYVSAKQASVLFACDNLDGHVALEDQSDTLAYTDASLQLFRRRAEFVPLQRLVEKSVSASGQATTELQALHAELPTKSCDRMRASSAISSFADATLLARQAKAALRGDRRLRLNAKKDSIPRLVLPGVSTKMIALATIANEGASLCVLIRNGTTYGCDSPGSPGSPYGAGFDGTYRDPRSDVLGGANDGGYAADNRRVGEDINEVTANINSRISDTTQRATEAKAALPDWVTKNGGFLEKETHDGVELEKQNRQDFQEFTLANAAALADAKTTLDEFLKQPADPARTRELVQSVNGRDVGLPSLSADRIPVGAPVLPGVSGRDRIYEMNSSAVDQGIARETKKIESLNGKPQLKSIAISALSAARRFSGRPGGEALAQMLIKDSASIRYYGANETDHVEITIVDENGHVSRAVISDPSALPANSLIARANRFEDDRMIFDVRARTLQDIVDQGHAEPIQRHALSAASNLSDSARQTFFDGDVITGAELLHLATTVLDVATALAPGVSWGRDIYEAVTGHNMITDDELSLAERTIAVIGAVSGGVVNEGPKIFKAIEQVAKIGESGERAEHILKAADRIDHTIEWSVHAREQLHRDEMIVHGLEKDNVEAALDRGTRFWDIDEQSIVAFEEQLAPSEWRAAAAVDPDKMKLVTVYAEQRTDKALAAVASEQNPLVKRFRRLLGE